MATGYVPLTFDELTPVECAYLLNGCGPGTWLGKLIPELIFHESCQRHDFHYWSGHRESDRRRYERTFRDSMLENVREGQFSIRWRKLYLAIVWVYYLSVLLFGRSSFSYRERYATRNELHREMRFAGWNPHGPSGQNPQLT